MQSRLNLHRHQLLQQQRARIRDLDLADVLCRVAPAAVVFEFEKICLAEKTALIAHVHSIAVTHIEETLLEESGRTVTNHAVTLHLSESETSVSRTTLCRLASQDLSRSTTT